MESVPTQIRIDKSVKEQACTLFNELGLDLSGAVNIFLRQCILHEGLPFPVEKPQYSQTVLAAMQEARQISRDSAVQSYTNMDELKKALLED